MTLFPLHSASLNEKQNCSSKTLHSVLRAYCEAKDVCLQISYNQKTEVVYPNTEQMYESRVVRYIKSHWKECKSRRGQPWKTKLKMLNNITYVALSPN